MNTNVGGPLLGIGFGFGNRKTNVVGKGKRIPEAKYWSIKGWDLNWEGESIGGRL